MKKLKYFASVICIILCSINSATAKTIKKTVKAGKKSFITTTYVLDKKRCRSGPYLKLASSSAKHGKITVERFKAKVPKGKKCAGTTLYHLIVDYTPNRGFRGKDTIKFAITGGQYSDGSGSKIVHYTGKITVK